MRIQVALGAASGAALLGMLVYCSPSPTQPTDDGGVGVCDDSGANCPCDPSKVKGAVDCYTGPRGSSNKGVCATGKRSCTSDGIWTDCVGEVKPSPEVCDYLDNDCDGIVDDVPGTSALSVDAGGASAIDTCQSPSCDPMYTDAGIACWSGTPRNVCKAGNSVCGAGRKLACEPFTGIAPTPEICNGWDDDCNDLVDDSTTDVGKCDVDPEAGITLPDGAIPKGECVHSTSTCDDGGLVCPPSDPGTETCNGKDDNCNGHIDEGTCPNGNWCCSYKSGSSTYGFCYGSDLTSFYTCAPMPAGLPDP